MKKLLKVLLAKAGYTVNRIQPESHFMQINLSYKDILWLLESGGDSITLVEVGAHDGVHANHVTSHVKNGGMRAVVIEPQPDLFEKLRKCYQGYDKVTAVNCAISSEEGHLPMYRLKKEYLTEDLPAWQNGNASLDREHLLRHNAMIETSNREEGTNYGKVREEMIEEIKVPCRRLDDILREQGIDRVDVLQIDAEGHDDVVLDTIDLDAFQVKILNFEWRHLPEESLKRIKQELTDKNWDITKHGIDLLCIRKNPPTES